MIDMYTGTIGSGKSYHALEKIIDALRAGKHVIANFPLNFRDNHITNGMADRYLYIKDKDLMGEDGMKLLYSISMTYNFGRSEGNCLVVIDEAGEYFPQHDYAKKEQLMWKLFMTQSRKLGYDFLLITQDDQAINRTIRKCVENEVIHRKANNVFPFNILPVTIFFHVTYWNKRPRKQRLGSDSTIYVKKLGELYDTHRLFADIDDKLNLEETDKYQYDFGNLIDDSMREKAFEKRKLAWNFFIKK